MRTFLNNKNRSPLIVRPKIFKTGNFKDTRGNSQENNVIQNNFSSVETIRAKKLVKNQILALLSDDDFANLLPYLETVSLPEGEILYSAEEHIPYVYFPESAVIFHLCTLADGNTIEIGMIGSEGASGLCSIFGLQSPFYRAQVNFGGHARRIKTEILKQKFCDGGNLPEVLFEYLTDCLARMAQKVICQSFHLIEKRLCSWLLTFHDRVKQNPMTLTQEQIALFLGANRPTVTLAASNLRNRELIKYTRGKIQILDRHRLESSACECYSAAQKFV